jgi:hypothetical protein
MRKKQFSAKDEYRLLRMSFPSSQGKISEQSLQRSSPALSLLP